AAARLRDVDARRLGLREPQQLQLDETLVQARGQRPAGRRRDDVLGRLPVELLDDLESARLRTLRVERPQRDVRELHLRRLRDVESSFRYRLESPSSAPRRSARISGV